MLVIYFPRFNVSPLGNVESGCARRSALRGSNEGTSNRPERCTERQRSAIHSRSWLLSRQAEPVQRCGDETRQGELPEPGVASSRVFLEQLRLQPHSSARHG